MTPSLDYRLDEIMAGSLCGICHASHDTVRCPHAKRFFAEGGGAWLQELWQQNDPLFAQQWNSK